MRIGYSFWSFIYLFYNLFRELDLPTVIQINWAWTSFKIIQRNIFFEIFYGISEPATRENVTSENVNENSIGENVGKMNENFKEKQKAFWNEMKKMSPF